MLEISKLLSFYSTDLMFFCHPTIAQPPGTCWGGQSANHSSYIHPKVSRTLHAPHLWCSFGWDQSKSGSAVKTHRFPIIFSGPL